MSAKNANICQSCGARVTRITEFGTYQDGSINTDYCLQCFEDGKFTLENKSLEARIAKNIQLAHKLGMSQAKAAKLADTVVPQIRKWRKRLRRKEENTNTE